MAAKRKELGVDDEKDGAAHRIVGLAARSAKAIARASQERIISDPPIGAANGNRRRAEEGARGQVGAEQDRARRQRRSRRSTAASSPRRGAHGR